MKPLRILFILVLMSLASVANAQTFNNTNCTDSIVPSAVSSFTDLSEDGGLIVVRYQSSTPCYTDFKLTPIYVRGNIERRLTSLAESTGGSQTWRFDKQRLINAAVALGARPGSQIKFKFGVVTYNSTLTSAEIRSPAITIQ